MNIFGVDTSKFQPLGTYDAGAHEVINIEDPTFEAKVQRNAIEGRPTDAYVWIYSNDRVGDFTAWAIIKAAGSGVQRIWADYEEEGVEGNWRLDQFFAACDQFGAPSGYYGNDWRFDHGRYRDRPFWLVGYPDPNDGVWRDHFQPRAFVPFNSGSSRVAAASTATSSRTMRGSPSGCQELSNASDRKGPRCTSHSPRHGAPCSLGS